MNCARASYALCVHTITIKTIIHNHDARYKVINSRYTDNFSLTLLHSQSFEYFSNNKLSSNLSYYLGIYDYITLLHFPVPFQKKIKFPLEKPWQKEIRKKRRREKSTYTRVERTTIARKRDFSWLEKRRLSLIFHRISYDESLRRRDPLGKSA